MSWSPEKQRAYYQANKQKVLEYGKLRRSKFGSECKRLGNMVKSLLRQRDGDFCSICGNLLEGQVEIDHIIPVYKGGLDEAENLRLCHKFCNRTRKRPQS